LLKPASEMGADALIDAHSSLYFGGEPNSIKRWASGMAVRWVDGTQEITPAPFVVCVPPLVNLDSDDPEQIGKDDLNARETAQHFLETLGYYAMRGAVPVTVEEVGAMNDDSLDQVIGKDAQLILIVTLESSGGANLGLVGSKETTLKASLVSRATREVVWTNTRSGSCTTLGLAATIMGGHREKSICSAAKNILSDLAPYDPQP
jgi:hypothetical protein